MKTAVRHAIGRLVTLVKASRSAFAMRRASSVEAHALARARLAELLGDARGLVMKIGQLAATGEETDPLRPLVTGVRPLPLARLKRPIERELGGPLNETFLSFDESRAAASLGQVHHGVLRDGRQVAVKVRYPGIGEAVRAELWLAGLLPGVGPAAKWGFDLRGYKRVLSENMTRELDYRDEANRQALFKRSVVVRGLVVPEVHPELSTKKLLVQRWESGVRLEQARCWPKRERLELGRTLLESLFVSLFCAGIVHGDPHSGNYLVRPSSAAGRAEVVLLDFGCTVAVSVEARLALLHLIVRTREGGALDALSAFAAMGFSVDKLAAIEPTLKALCFALFRPFLGEGAFPIAEWALGTSVEQACGELKWWFRAAGPPELLLLLRAFQGVCQHLTTLDVALPWWALLAHAVGEERLAEARAWSPRPCTPSRRKMAASQAQLLRVCVEERATERMRLALPAREALTLRDIVPEDIKARISQRGIDLAAIEQRLRRTGLTPGPVIEDRQGDVSFRVWLE